MENASSARTHREQSVQLLLDRRQKCSFESSQHPALSKGWGGWSQLKHRDPVSQLGVTRDTFPEVRSSLVSPDPPSLQASL